MKLYREFIAEDAVTRRVDIVNYGADFAETINDLNFPGMTYKQLVRHIKDVYGKSGRRIDSVYIYKNGKLFSLLKPKGSNFEEIKAEKR